MIRNYFIAVLLLLGFSNVHFGQPVNDTIRYSRAKWDIKYYKGSQEIKFLELSKILREDPATKTYLNKAKLYRNLNGVFVGIGTISLAYGLLFGLKEAVENKESSNAYAGLIAGTLVGGAFIALSIPSGKSYKINAKKAIDVYNRDLMEVTSHPVEFKVGIAQNGFSIIIGF